MPPAKANAKSHKQTPCTYWGCLEKQRANGDLTKLEKDHILRRHSETPIGFPSKVTGCTVVYRRNPDEDMHFQCICGRLICSRGSVKKHYLGCENLQGVITGNNYFLLVRSENKSVDVLDGEEDEGEDEEDEMETIGATSGSIVPWHVPTQLPPSCSAASSMMAVREQQTSFIMSALKLQQDQGTRHQHQLLDHQQKLLDQQRQYAELSLVVQRLQRQVEQAHGEQSDLETQPIQQQQRRIAHIEQRQEEQHQKHQRDSLEQLHHRAQAQATTTTADSQSSRGNVPDPEPSSSGPCRLPNYETTLAITQERRHPK
ncbi:MAG: hypothetical protein JOS17DRAFT_727208 [Linnemannia elongata]|nr:MAG: hypothetical protein JOS17DRAFT_727208 [Linnemannia elongata]